MSLRSFITRLVSQLHSWLRAVLHRGQLEERMDFELVCHLELLTSDLMRSGSSPEEAARRARIALGPMLKHQEDMRASLGLRWWDQFSADLRYGARLLRKSPSFTVVAAVSLALAIGVNTTIFSLARQLLYERLDVRRAEELRLLALTPAAVGIYGIMAYSVASRRNEIGIRLALGAQPGQVRGMILREGTWLAAAGIAVGMAAALALTRLIQSMLYGIRPYDPLTLSAGVGLLLAVVVAATWIPARRASSVLPMEALRHE